MATASKRITVQYMGRGSKVTVICAPSIAETRFRIGTKLGLPNPSTCRLFNRFGGEIDDVDVILVDDFLVATSGENFPARPMDQFHGHYTQSTLPMGHMGRGVASTITPFPASTIGGEAEAATSGKGEQYEIGKILGTGGQGTTYLATDRRNGVQIVLKQIFCSSLAETNKAIEEGVMLSRLKHPRVVSYNEVFLGKDPNKGNYVGIVTGYCAGGDLYLMLLRQRNKKKPMSVRRVKRWILQLSEALAFLHSMKVIHRDVKPMNVLVDSEGDLKMANFGLAREGVSPSRLAMMECSTPGYESPEVQMGQGYDFKTDVWGLGCVVCDMTTLRFMHERPGSLATQVQVDPKAIVKVIQAVMELYGPDIHALLASMLQADPKRRPSANEILEMKFLRPNAPAPEADISGPAAPPSGSPPPMKGSLDGAGRQGASNTGHNSSGPDDGRTRSDVPTLVPAARRPDQQARAWSDASAAAAIVGGVAIPAHSPVEARAQERAGRADGAGRDGGKIENLISGLCSEGSGSEREISARGPSGLARAETVASTPQAMPPSIADVGVGLLRHSDASAREDESPATTRGVRDEGRRLFVVSKRPGKGEFGTISDAIKAAEDGAIIQVMEGKYQEEIVLDKALTIQAYEGGGRGPSGPIDVEGWGARPVLSSRAKGAVLKGLRLLHLATVSSEGRECTRCVDVADGQLRIEECYVTSVCGVGVVVRDGARLEAFRCRVSRCGQNGMFFFSRGGALVEGCEVMENCFPGIGMDQSVNTTVRGTRVQGGKADGVKIYGGRGILLEGNDISHNAMVGISIEDKADPVIRKNLVHDGKSCGISVMTESKGLIEDNDIYSNEHPNVYVSGGAAPVVRNNRIFSSGSCGVTCVDEGLGTVENNDIFGNESVGVYIMNRADPIVRNNTIRDGRGDGVAVVFAGKGTVEGNKIRGNAGMGILVESEAEPRILSNTISEAQGDGIRVSDNGRGLIEGNTVETAGRGPRGGSGMVVMNGSTPTIRNNAVRECAGHGIHVSDAARPVIEANVVSLCRSHGVVITREADPIVRANLVRDNGGIGVWICATGKGTLCDNRMQGNRGGHQLLVEAGAQPAISSPLPQPLPPQPTPPRA